MSPSSTFLLACKLAWPIFTIISTSIFYHDFREYDEKLCYLGLTSLIALTEERLSADALRRGFCATLDLLAAYNDQVAEKAQKLTMCPSIIKYWHQRYSLFFRYDESIKMDEECWYSVTLELIAQHHALRCGSEIIIDCFTGARGNAIQFAMRGNHVIAIDIDPKKFDFAQHNANIYGVNERINFIKDGFFKIAPYLKGDVAFLDPPWGGLDYAKLPTYDIKSLKPRDGFSKFLV